MGILKIKQFFPNFFMKKLEVMKIFLNSLILKIYQLKIIIL